MSVLTTFGVNYKLLIVSIINFVILLYLLNKILYKPILSMLEQRKATIAESLKNAESIENKLKETNEKEKEVLRQARQDAEQLLRRAEEEVRVKQQEVIKQAEEQAQQIVKMATIKMEQRAAELEQQIKINLASLVIESVRVILQDKAPTDISEQYTETVINIIKKQAK